MGLYAAYGSNMDPAQMRRRCPASPHTGTGWIRGWRLTFGGEELGWEGALATLVPAEDDGSGGDAVGVFVALYDLTEADERALDAPDRGSRPVARTTALGPSPGYPCPAMTLYAAYGSNMDPAQMLRRCPSSPHTGTGWIRGWRLTFGGEELGWEGALATLVPAEDDGSGGDAVGVFVALYDLTEADERALDAFESGLPSARHLGAIADAAEAAGAPRDYVADLRSRECRTAF